MYDNFSMSLLMRRLNHTLDISVTLPWIFPGAPLIFNGLPEISRITLTGMPWCGHNIWYVAPLYKDWLWYVLMSLHWCHNGRNSVSNHQSHDCLLNGLFRRRSKKTWKLRVTGLCAGNSPGTGEFPAQMASNAENGIFPNGTLYLQNVPTCHWYHSYIASCSLL